MKKNFTFKEVMGISLIFVLCGVGYISKMSIDHRVKLADKNGVRLADSIRISWLERDLENRTIELVECQQSWAKENVSERYRDSVGYKQKLENKFKEWAKNKNHKK